MYYLFFDTSYITLRDGLVSQGVHPHSNGKVIQSVEKLTERLEFAEGDSSPIWDSVQKSLQIHLIPNNAKVHKKITVRGPTNISTNK